jgi:hypothetical protein
MKTPIKPFSVEVKRSRSNFLVPDLERAEPPPRNEHVPFVSQQAQPQARQSEQANSQARQAAELAFKALTATPGPATARIVLEAEEPATPSQERPGTKASSPEDHDGSPPKPRRARKPSKGSVVSPSPDKVALPRRGSAKTARPAPIEVAEDVRELPLHGAEPMPAPELVPTPIEHDRSTSASEWRRGERWKRRLRHLR